MVAGSATKSEKTETGQVRAAGRAAPAFSVEAVDDRLTTGRLPDLQGYD